MNLEGNGDGKHIFFKKKLPCTPGYFSPLIGGREAEGKKNPEGCGYSIYLTKRNRMDSEAFLIPAQKAWVGNFPGKGNQPGGQGSMFFAT